MGGRRPTNLSVQYFGKLTLYLAHCYEQIIRVRMCFINTHKDRHRAIIVGLLRLESSNSVKIPWPVAMVILPLALPAVYLATPEVGAGRGDGGDQSFGPPGWGAMFPHPLICY